MGIGATPQVNSLSFILNSYQIRLFNTVKAEIFGKIKNRGNYEKQKDK